MRASKIIIDVLATLGQPPYWLCEITEDWEYKNNIRTDTLLGWKYIVAVPGLALERIAVKIPGPKMIELSDGEIVEVIFQGLELTQYIKKGTEQISLSARATGIAIASEGER